MRMTLFACLLVLPATPAIAEPIADRVNPKSTSVTREIALTDLNLTSASGARVLRHRISNAVQEVCAEAVGPDNGSAEFTFGMMKCRKHASREAHANMAQVIAAARAGATRTAALATAMRASAAAPAK